MKTRIYLDHNATTPLDPRVFKAMLPDLQGPPANPSSVHSFGRAAKRLLDEARDSVAKFFGVRSEGVLFTSGGTESMNLILRSLPRGSVVTSNIEHSSIYNTVQEPAWVKAGLFGAPTPEQVEAAIRPETKAIVL